MKLFLLFIGIVLSGCSSTGVIPMGENLYTISKTSNACGLVTATGVRTDVLKEMNTFCKGKSLESEVIKIRTVDGRTFSRCANASVKFRCVAKSKINLNEPRAQTDVTLFRKLIMLKEMLNSGAITQSEYKKLKNDILK